MYGNGQSLVFADLYYFASSVGKRLVFGLNVGITHFGQGLSIFRVKDKRVFS
jgi:hypothetical protein